MPWIWIALLLLCLLPLVVPQRVRRPVRVMSAADVVASLAPRAPAGD